MERIILVSSSKTDTRIAVLEDDDLVEFLLEEPEERSLVGNIYKGKVVDVVPGLQSAFINIGFERRGFLHRNDISHQFPIKLKDIYKGDFKPKKRKLPPIEKLLRSKDDILVQVKKDPIDDKGPKLTTGISIPGKYLVMIPFMDRVGVSHKISDKNERNRLRNIVRNSKNNKHGYIIRTASRGIDGKNLRRDFADLNQKWKEMLKLVKSSSAPELIFRQPGIVSDVLRDLFISDLDSLIVDEPSVYSDILSDLSEESPEMASRVQFYDGKIPLFDAYGIEKDLEIMTMRKVWLKSGGFIVIEQSEAMITIDVNTGSYTGKKDLEKTILKTNLEATTECARQIRLRDLGGIIVIDFIDQKKESNRRKVISKLKEEMSRDRSKHTVLELPQVNLVVITRKRVRSSITKSITESCPYCNGKGRILSVSHLIHTIKREINRIFIMMDKNKITITVHPFRLKVIKERTGDFIKEFQRENNIKIEYKTDETMAIDGVEVK